MDPLPDGWTQVNARTPSPARVYDYLLGGKRNYAPDRDLADAMEAEGGVRELARINRAFILSASRWCASMLGIAQFIDLGAGLPSVPALHDTAREGCPEARVVYVDRDPGVIDCLASRISSQGGEGLAVVKADAADPARVLEIVADLGLNGNGEFVDLSRPACLIFGGTLSAMPSDVARNAVAAYAKAVAPGSAIVISCASYEDRALGERMAGLYAAAEPGWRNHSLAEVESFFLAAGLKPRWGPVGNVRCWPLTPEQTGLAEPANAAVIGGIGIRDLASVNVVACHRAPGLPLRYDVLADQSDVPRV